MITIQIKKLTILFILTGNYFICFTQENTPQNSNFTSEIIESQTENLDETIENFQIVDELESILQNPIDLNSATSAELGQLPMLNPFQVKEIIEHRNTHGPFLSVYELNGVKGISVITLKEITPFVKVENNNEQPTRKKQFIKHNLLVNTGRVLEKMEGYNAVNIQTKDSFPDKYFPGSPYRFKTRYQVEYGKYNAGISAEKDPGEEWFGGSNKSFDYISAYAQRKSTGFLNNIILGDFNANFGQGLVIWSGFAPGMSSFATNISKQKGRFSKYSSFNENQYLRGIASTFHTEYVDVSLLFSNKQRDANITAKDTTGKAVIVSSFQNTGFHAMNNEIDDEDALGEKIFGTNANFNFRNFNIGGTLTFLEYSTTIKKSDELYNFYSFTGKNLVCGSINYQVDGRRWSFFGETARNNTKGTATFNGLTIELIPEVNMAIAHRYFSTEYYSPYSQSFSQNGSVTNEQGMYLGIEFVPEQKWKLSAYADYFHFPWLKYQVDEPSSGNNYFAEINYSLNETTNISARYNFSRKPKNIISELSEPLYVIYYKLHKPRIQVSYKASESVELINRIELAFYKNEQEEKQQGILLYQDIKWRPLNPNIFIVCRLAIFNTDGWESRLYAYENDVLYSFSIPTYSGKGCRSYCMVKWALPGHLNFWLRYSISLYADKHEIGQTANLIKDNKKSDISFQCTFNF